MTKIPPQITYLIISLCIIGSFVGGNFSGWFLRMASESRAELSVVVDDGDFERELILMVLDWVDEYNLFDEEFHRDYEVPKCLGDPMPTKYHDNDFIVRDRESEE